MIPDMLRIAAIVLVAAGLAASAPAPVAAEIYRYTDERGQSVYVEGLDNVPQAFRARAVPLGLRNAPAAATPAPGAPAGASGAASVPKTGTTIKYTPGQRIMVDAKINGSTNAQLLLDTGADKTMINPRVLLAAGASLSRPVGAAQVTGVGGSEQVSFVIVDSLEVGGARVDQLAVASYDVASAGDGLLGRDFLDRFSVTIDSTNGVVTLAPK
jgi:predicted aspartyl protease